MAGTVVKDLEDISLCDATTGWTGSPTPALHDTTIWDQIQGSRCLQSYVAGAAVRNAAFDFGATSGYWKNFSGKLLVIWFSFSRKAYSATNPPMKIRLTDGNGYYRDWYIFDKNTLPNTSWIPWCIHAEVGYDYESNPSFDVTKIRYVGWRIEETVLGKTYIWWDAVRFGTGLSIKGGTSESGDEATLENIYQADIHPDNAYGIMEKIGEVYYSQGQIKIGSMTANESTYFKDKSQILVFKTIKGNPTGFYEIKGQRAATGTGATKIFFGETGGISGCVFKAPLEMKFKVTMTDAGITEFGINGCIFQNADTISLPVYNPNKIVLNTSFEYCDKVIASTTTMMSCTWINAPDVAVLIHDYDHRITYSNFIKCAYAVEIDIANTVENPQYYFDGLKFTDNTKDVHNTSGGAVLVKCRYGANADKNKVTGDTTISNPITLKLTEIVEGSEIIVLEHGTQNELGWIDELVGTEFSYDYDPYVPNTYVDIYIHKKDYEWWSLINYLLLDSNANIPVSQRKDRVYFNPSNP